MKTNPKRSLPSALVSAALYAAFASALAVSSAAQDRKPIRLATLAPKGTSFHKILLEMGEKWRAAPEGGVKLIVYPDGTMGGESAMVSKMRTKQLQAGLLTVAGLELIDRSADALQNMPLMFHSLEEVAYVRDRLMPLIEKRFAEKGFVVLFLGDVGWVRYFSKTPIVRPDDLKKVKLFTMPGDTYQVDLMKSLGLNPYPLEPADLFTGLQTGLVDAIPMVPFYAQTGQFYKTTKYMLELDWAPLVGGCVIVKEAFDALPPATRDALIASARASGEAMNARNRIENEESVKAMQAGGLQIHKPTPEELAEWRAWIEPIYAKIRGTEVPADLYDGVVDALKEKRARDAALDGALRHALDGQIPKSPPEPPKSPEPPKNSPPPKNAEPPKCSQPSLKIATIRG